MLKLADLGSKICIIGCSCSGKSTLAAQLANKVNLPSYHLDILAHYPSTKWQRRSDEEFVAAHSKILQEPQWIIEGNYSICMQERFNQATAIIWLDLSPLTCVIRYLIRCFKNKPHRAGRLPDAKSEFSFFMLKHILFNYRKNSLKYQKLINTYQLPIIKIKSLRELNHYYKFWQL